MANSSAKKLQKSNRARLKSLLQLFTLTNILLPLFRHVLLRRPLTSALRKSYPLLTLLFALPLTFLYYLSRPTYDPATAALLHPGHDISSGILCEYAHDLIYLCTVTAVSLPLSNWAWLVFLAVPAYLVYFIVLWGMSARGQETVDGDGGVGDGEDAVDLANMSRKDRRKAQRQARKMR